MATDDCWLQGLSQKLSAAIVRISDIKRCGVIALPIFCMAKMASAAFLYGTKNSACNSLPLLGVNPILKCGKRSYHLPGTPICSVQFSAEISMIGCKFFVAGLAPKKSGFTVLLVSSSIRLLIHT